MEISDISDETLFKKRETGSKIPYNIHIYRLT